MDRALTEKKTMGYAKVMWLLGDVLGIPLTILGIIANLDNVKSLVLFVLLVGYLTTRWYYYAKKQDQEARKRELELWHMEMNKKERQLEYDRKHSKVNGK